MRKTAAAALFALVIMIAAYAYSSCVQTDLQNNLVRLHIIANSDSEYDQKVKFCVRDEVLKYEKEKLIDIENIENALGDIEKTAAAVLEKNGVQYGARAEYGKFYFPKKEYKNIILPQGEYYGVRVILGNGKGKNWWCVMYPPLCMLSDNEAVMSGKSQKLLEEALDSETYDVITENNGKIKIKFRIVEAVQCLKEYIKRSAKK